MMGERFDLIVVGAGPGGYEAALEAAKNGMKTALIEKKKIGGVCLNAGCVPMKRLLYSTDLYRRVKAGKKFGICGENICWEEDEAWAGIHKIVKELQTGILELLRSENVAVYEGEGILLGSGRVSVQGRELFSRFILLATGSRERILPGHFSDLKDSGIISVGAALEEGKLYRHPVIVGGGVSGCEMASVYGNLGREAILVEKGETLLPGIDREASKNLEQILKSRGIKIYKKTVLAEIKRGTGGLICVLHHEEKDHDLELETDGIINAAGRVGRLPAMADRALLAQDEKGIVTGKYGETSCPGIYAVGDITGEPMLACRAAEQGRRAVAHMLGKKTAVSELIPSCVFTSPEIAAVGLSEAEAKASGITPRIYRYPMSANVRSWISEEDRGFMKIIVCPETNRILGATLVCAHASDIISEFSVALTFGITAEELSRLIHPHPTFEEAAGDLFRLCQG
jgi:dihydrolipoamide dehydrogenase